ncbi:MAG TPA: MarR family transcriptional regulator [Solirubrobacteraceae bacterium]
MASKPLSFDPIAEARRQWESHWGAQPAPAMAAVTSIMRCQQILLTGLNELLKPFELTFPRYELLMLLYLSRRGSLPLGKIGERLQVHRTSVTGLVDRLEQQGLARRLAHESDRRKTLAQITPAGRRTAERATKLLNQARFSVPGGLDESLDELVRLLEEMRLAAGDFTRH